MLLEIWYLVAFWLAETHVDRRQGLSAPVQGEQDQKGQAQADMAMVESHGDIPDG